MTVVTLKARAKTRSAKVASLIQKAREQATPGNDRVLVVYGEDAANIYFEGEPRKPSTDA